MESRSGGLSVHITENISCVQSRVRNEDVAIGRNRQAERATGRALGSCEGRRDAVEAETGPLGRRERTVVKLGERLAIVNVIGRAAVCFKSSLFRNLHKQG